MTCRTWDPDAPGVMRLPSGRLVRGRGLRRPIATGPTPDFGVYLQGKEPAAFVWECRWIRWMDFWLPSDSLELSNTLREVLQRSAGARVEIACGGGFGRTGTALACLVALDGVPGRDAVEYVRTHYSRRAIETPWQKRFAQRFVQSKPLL